MGIGRIVNRKNFVSCRYFYIYTLGNTEPIMTKETGYAFEAMLENMPQIFHTASNWLTLALAMQRWVYICHVDAARVWCTMNKTRRGIAAIFIFAFLHQTTR
jgi:neuromedin U receptor 1